MLPIANPTFHLHVLQLLLWVIRRLFLVLTILFPCDAGAEDDVFANGSGVEGRAGSVAFFETEFGPGFALGDAGVDVFFDDGGADAARGFDAFAIVVEAVRHYGFGAVFVGGDDLWREGGGVVEFFVVGPVWAAAGVG